jgi:hypothetical protein
MDPDSREHLDPDKGSINMELLYWLQHLIADDPAVVGAPLCCQTG